MKLKKLRNVSQIPDMLKFRGNFGETNFKGNVCFIKSSLLKDKQKEDFVRCFEVIDRKINKNKHQGLEVELTMLFVDEKNEEHIHQQIGLSDKESLGESIYMLIDNIRLELSSVIVDVFHIDKKGKKISAENFLIIAV